jgi:hypothetical protein
MAPSVVSARPGEPVSQLFYDLLVRSALHYAEAVPAAHRTPGMQAVARTMAATRTAGQGPELEWVGVRQHTEPVGQRLLEGDDAVELPLVPGPRPWGPGALGPFVRFDEVLLPHQQLSRYGATTKAGQALRDRVAAFASATLADWVGVGSEVPSADGYPGWVPARPMRIVLAPADGSAPIAVLPPEAVRHAATPTPALPPTVVADAIAAALPEATQAGIDRHLSATSGRILHARPAHWPDGMTASVTFSWVRAETGAVHAIPRAVAVAQPVLGSPTHRWYGFTVPQPHPEYPLATAAASS